MKKVLYLFVFLVSFHSFAFYTDQDVGYANLLAEKGIIKQQAISGNYRLDDKILRQEIIGMALKVKGVNLPDNYKCKKYFSDATEDDWVCRAVEIAADNGIISRKNTSSRSKDFVTPEEATVMFMNAKGISYPKNVKIDPGVVQYTGKSQWMIDLHEGIGPLGISLAWDNVSGNTLRKNVFRTVYQILSYEPGLKFVPCGLSDEKAQILLGKNKFDISEFGDLTDCRGIGYGQIYFRDKNKIYVTLSGEISGGSLAVLDLITMKSELVGYNHSLLQDGKSIVWFENDGDSGSGLTVLDLESNVKNEYTLPLIRGLVDGLRFSPNKNIVAIFASDFGGPEARVYILDRASKKTSTHEFMMLDGYSYNLLSVSNEGKYYLNKTKY